MAAQARSGGCSRGPHNTVHLTPQTYTLVHGVAGGSAAFALPLYINAYRNFWLWEKGYVRAHSYARLQHCSAPSDRRLLPSLLLPQALRLLLLRGRCLRTFTNAVASTCHTGVASRHRRRPADSAVVGGGLPLLSAHAILIAVLNMELIHALEAGSCSEH